MNINNYRRNQYEVPRVKAKLKNRQEFLNWIIRLQNIVLSQFEWDGLPDTVDPFLMEWALLWYGKMCFVDYAGNIVSLPTADGGNLNLYGYPVNAYAYGFNGTVFEFKPYMRGTKLTEENLKDCNGVICYDNSLRYPYINFCLESSERLSDNIRTIDNVVKAFKAPYFVQCNSNQEPSLKRVLKQVDNNEPNIVVADTFDINSLQVLNTGIKGEILTSLWDNYTNTFDVFKDTFGIANNQQSDKKERLITAEVESNNDYVNLAIDSRLKQRETFCNIINEKWGLNVSVKINEKVGDDYNEVMDEIGRLGNEPDSETDSGERSE